MLGESLIVELNWGYKCMSFAVPGSESHEIEVPGSLQGMYRVHVF